MAETQAKEKKVPTFAMTQVGDTGLIPTSGAEMWSMSQAIAASGLAPKGITTPEAILIALQMGMELGLPPMAALQNIAVINGRPSLWGDAQLAVCRATGELEEFREWYEHDGKELPRNPVTYEDGTVAVCRVKRRGQEPVEIGFSVADAKRAKLWGKAGPWSEYPFRMLRARARSYALRDAFGDALRGMISSEEASDLTVDAVQFKPLPAPQVAVERKTDKLKSKLLESVAAAAVSGEVEAEQEPEPEVQQVDAVDQHPESARVRDQYLEQANETTRPALLQNLLKDAMSDELLSDADRDAVVADIADKLAIAEEVSA